MSEMLRKLRLDFNPFEPSATGVPLAGELSFPQELVERTLSLLDVHQTGRGVKAIVIVGEYGTGKTCLLHWLHKILPSRQIKSFYFDNPGVQFYDLANMLLRTIGRKDFAKFIWELAGTHVTIPYQRTLFQDGFEEYLSATFRPRGRQPDMTGPLQEAIQNAGVTTDEQIAHCLARIVTDIVKKPYFEYRDFIPRQQGSVVAEGEEAPYFRAILKTISQGTGAKAIAFLIDEFEEIGLQKRLTKRAAHDYLATLKRLINLSQNEQVDFWIVLSMTPDAYKTTSELEPSMMERVSDQTLRIEPLTREDAFTLMKSRVRDARSGETDESIGTLFPFPDEIAFRPNTYSNPRRLVKVCFRAIGQADTHTQLPFSEDYLHRVEEELYPIRPQPGVAKP